MNFNVCKHPKRRFSLKSKPAFFTVLFLLSLVFHNSYAWARCHLNIEGSISSGWNKKSVSYTVSGNTVKVKVGEMGWDDSDSIYIGSLRGCRTLTVNVSQISGEYPWNGKAFGISFANDLRESHQWGNFASFPRPRGYKIDDGFIRSELSNNTKLIYDIPNSSLKSYFGAKVFLGSHNTLELEFSAQEDSYERQLGAQQPSRSSGRETASSVYHSDSPPISCSMNCHEPSERNQSAHTREFSTSLPSDCRN